MKTARYLAIAMLGIFVATTRASADPTASNPPSNPYTQYDPDGVPLSVTQQQPKRLSQEDINAIHKQQEKAALDKNWLLRNYEHQLRTHAPANSSEDQGTDIYYQLSSNKELAKLAGLPSLGSDSQDNATSYRTGAAPSAVALRTDTPSATAIGFPSHASLFSPLITPDAAGLHSFYSSLPVSMAAPFSASPSKPSADQFQDSSDIETPGMVAAENNPLMDTSASNPALDILPGESIEHARAHQDNNNNLLELPLPMDAAQLHKEQTAALSVPGAANTAQTTAPAPVKTIPIEDQDAPLPVSKAPQINPVRAPIANPYDILNR